MKKIVLLVSALTSAMVSGNVFAGTVFDITKANAGLGDNNFITLEQTTKLNITGNAIHVGDSMPSMLLKTSDLGNFDTSKNDGKVRIYNVVASVDTPVCVQQMVDLTSYVKQNSNKLKGIEVLAISADTPFAQQRFLTEKKLNGSLLFLSDSINHDFGKKTGTQIKDLGLLARSIIVVGKDNKVLHVQRVPELTTIPDLEQAVAVAKKHI